MDKVYVKFVDLQGEEHEKVIDYIPTEEDQWHGESFEGEDVAFEYNVFDYEDGEWFINVYQLDPKRKEDGNWTMNGMQELKVLDHRFFPRFTHRDLLETAVTLIEDGQHEDGTDDHPEYTRGVCNILAEIMPAMYIPASDTSEAIHKKLLRMVKEKRK